MMDRRIRPGLALTSFGLDEVLFVVNPCLNTRIYLYLFTEDIDGVPPIQGLRPSTKFLNALYAGEFSAFHYGKNNLIVYGIEKP